MPYDPLLPIDSIDIGERFRKDLGDLDELASSIAAIGLLHPITVLPGKRSGRWLLVAGERRLRACQRLGMDRIAARVLSDPEALLRAEHDENVVREPFAPSEAVAIAAALMPAAKAEAQARMLAGGPSAKSAEARHEVAAAVGMSHATLRKATQVVDAEAAGLVPPEVVERMDETGNVEAAHRETQRLLANASAAMERSDPAVAESARQARLSRAIRDHSRAQMHLEPADWADGMNEADVAVMRAHLVGFAEWTKRWEAAIDRPALRVVGGIR